MVQNSRAYFCPECLHVYYKIPESNRCSICDNEITKESTVSPLDILTCETCHTLYTVQKIDDIIPENIPNPHHLCGCVHFCPSNSSLGIGSQEKYLGNIVVADIYQCSNCQAISFSNLENRHKICSQCGSRFVYPFHWNAKTQKLLFKCANPNHGIRLNFRDLLIENNKRIEETLYKVKKKDEELKDRYNIKKRNLHKNFEERRFGDRIKQAINKLQHNSINAYKLELDKLNAWALKERKRLYSEIRPLPIRCVVYMEDKADPNKKIIKTGEGCGALAKIRIRKIFNAPDGTVLERPIKNFDEKRQNNSDKNLLIPDWRENIVPLVDDNNQSLFTRIQRDSPNDIKETKDENQKVQLNFEKAKTTKSKTTEGEDPLVKLPVPLENQIFLLIELISNPDEESANVVNWGIIPIIFHKDDIKIRIGRTHFINAYWRKTSFFKEYPYMFDNISPLNETSEHFSLYSKNLNEWKLDISNSLINRFKFENIDNDQQLSEKMNSIPLENNFSFSFPAYYPLSYRKIGMFSQFQFNITIKIHQK